MRSSGEPDEPGRRNLAKAAETRARILQAALTTFRERGFERATMREIAAAAGVAVGAAYYYFASKDALVLAFYEKAQEDMRPRLEAVLADEKLGTLKKRMRGIIGCKLEYFATNRALLGLLTAHNDPRHPLSPFSEQTRAIREAELDCFRRAIAGAKGKLPKSLAPWLPWLLWLYQMGLLLFWVHDASPGQRRTAVLFEKTLDMLVFAVRLARLPLLKPVHRLAAELVPIVFEEE